MSQENSLFDHHKTLLSSLYQHCASQPPFSLEEASDTDREVLAALEVLQNASQRSEHFTELGQFALRKIVASYPHLTPAINRDLFWFFGGDCLHYLSDEELENYQRLDELLYEQEQTGQAINFAAAKASVFKMH